MITGETEPGNNDQSEFQFTQDDILTALNSAMEALRAPHGQQGDVYSVLFGSTEAYLAAIRAIRQFKEGQGRLIKVSNTNPDIDGMIVLFAAGRYWATIDSERHREE